MFLQTTGRMLQAHPFAGVGVGQYGRWSAVFSSPELKAYYPRENAHNNFAQIAGELGLPGFGAFLAVLGLALVAPAQPFFSKSMVRVASAGLVVFMITWLGGHPLLVAEVAYPFWLILGVVAGSSTPAREAIPRRA
jgi:O-antigen ligase